jgi:hypothetical protein
MKITRTLVSALALFLVTSCAGVPWGTEAEVDSWLAHDVYFDLVDDSPAACDVLVEACWELADLEGIRFFASGTRAKSIDHGVNDLGYDVSLHVFFIDEAAYDAYLIHPKHLKLVEDHLKSWASVRVFDSFVGAQFTR